MLEGIIVALILTNALTLLWAFKTRVSLKLSPQVKALQRAVAAFEIQNQTVLRIERISPDSIFLRNPGRME